jgi:MFS family permease
VLGSLVLGSLVLGSLMPGSLMLGARLRRVAIDTEPLRHRDFRRLFVGQGVSYVGYWLTAVAVPVQVYEITRSSFWVGMLGLVALGPLVVFGLCGGAVADIVDRRLLLLASSTVTWVVTLALLVQALPGLASLPLILALVAVQSAAFAVTSPVRNAIVPRLIPVRLVPAANTLNFTVTNVGTVAGPLLAGVVIARFGGFAAAYGIDAVLFTVALYAALRLPALPPGTQLPALPPGTQLPALPSGTQPGRDGNGEGAAGAARARVGLRSVVDGLRFIAGRHVLLMSFAVDIVAMVFAMPRALFPEVAAARFGGPGAVGWLFAAIAIGAVVGGLLSGWIGRVHRQGVALVAAVVCWGLAVAASGLAGSLWLAVLLLAVAGAADLVSAVFRQTILQVYAPDEMRGRLQGVFIVVVAGGPRLGDLRAGATAAALGVTVSWVAGGIVCAAAVLALAVASPSLLRYEVARPVPAQD